MIPADGFNFAGTPLKSEWGQPICFNLKHVNNPYFPKKTGPFWYILALAVHTVIPAMVQRLRFFYKYATPLSNPHKSYKQIYVPVIKTLVGAVAKNP